MTSDPTLLQRIARGDTAAVEAVLERYSPLVWTLVQKQVGFGTAEDLVQEIFIAVWKSADRFDPSIASEATYISTIARRRITDHRRRAGSRPGREECELEVEPEPERVDRVELEDESRLAERALAQLRPEQQRLIRMAVVEGMTHGEIAVVTRLPLGTVKTHVRRGLERVRALLGGAGDEREASKP